MAFEIFPATNATICPHTENISIELNSHLTRNDIGEFPLEDWTSSLHHLLHACPNLKKLCIHLTIDGYYYSEQSMHATLVQMEKGVKALSEIVLLKAKPESQAEIEVDLRFWMHKDMVIKMIE